MLILGGQEVKRPSGRNAEKTPRRSHPNLPPFLSKLLGKTSKLRVFPSKLRRNGPKCHLIIRYLQRRKIARFSHSTPTFHLLLFRQRYCFAWRLAFRSKRKGCISSWQDAALMVVAVFQVWGAFLFHRHFVSLSVTARCHL